MAATETLTEIERLVIGTCVVTETQSAPWAAVAATTWRVDCSTEGCQLAAGGLDRGTAVDTATLHRCRTVGRTCSVCGAPCDGPWCSRSCHEADEPGAYEMADDAYGPFDEDVVYGPIGEDL